MLGELCSSKTFVVVKQTTPLHIPGVSNIFKKPLLVRNIETTRPFAQVFEHVTQFCYTYKDFTGLQSEATRNREYGSKMKRIIQT